MKKIKDFCCVYVGRIEDFQSNEVLHSFIQADLKHIKSPKIINQKKASYGLLKKAVQETLGIDDDFLTIKREPSGKPVCEKYHFSISHCQSLVAVAISNTNVGIDVETVKERENIKKIVMCENENNLDVKDVSALMCLWTKKEAKFKFDGGHLFIPKNIDTTSFACFSTSFEYAKHKYWVSVVNTHNDVKIKYLF